MKDKTVIFWSKIRSSGKIYFSSLKMASNGCVMITTDAESIADMLEVQPQSIHWIKCGTLQPGISPLQKHPRDHHKK